METGAKTSVITSTKTSAMTSAMSGLKSEKEILRKLTDTERRIIEQIKANPFITQKELAAATGISHAGVRYAMKGLKEMGLVIRIGTNRIGKWQLKD
jgi:predicted transcriptional regulator